MTTRLLPPTQFIVLFLFTFVLVVLLLQTQSLKQPVSFYFSSRSPALSSQPFLNGWSKFVGTTTGDSDEYVRRLANATSRLRSMVEFLPLKDLRFADTHSQGHTWFMSSINDTLDGDVAEHLHFPSEASKGRLLCLAGNDLYDGKKNSYALAWKDSLPENSTLLGGLTFVSDTYYDYSNLWHSQAAMLPFVAWHKWKGCAVPARWVLYHWGELRTGLGSWIGTLMGATFRQRITIEKLDKGGGGGPTCFEEAVVFRHNEGSIPKSMRTEIYDLMRCRAREYCNITVTERRRDPKAIRMTLLLRTGTRSFKNDTAVIEIFRRVCRKFDGCRVTFARPDNMTFCDQVKAMSKTDVLVSQHGAQMANMIFMDRNSSVMEFFPRGWLELAGVGQYVFHWLADWAGMRHQGGWWDKEEGGGGLRCPLSAQDVQCFFLYKDGQIGHHEGFFSNWTSNVLRQVREYRANLTVLPNAYASDCPCN